MGGIEVRKTPYNLETEATACNIKTRKQIERIKGIAETLYTICHKSFFGFVTDGNSRPEIITTPDLRFLTDVFRQQDVEDIFNLGRNSRFRQEILAMNTPTAINNTTSSPAAVTSAVVASPSVDPTVPAPSQQTSSSSSTSTESYVPYSNSANRRHRAQHLKKDFKYPEEFDEFNGMNVIDKLGYCFYTLTGDVTAKLAVKWIKVVWPTREDFVSKGVLGNPPQLWPRNVNYVPMSKLGIDDRTKLLICMLKHGQRDALYAAATEIDKWNLLAVQKIVGQILELKDELSIYCLQNSGSFDISNIAAISRPYNRCAASLPNHRVSTLIQQQLIPQIDVLRAGITDIRNAAVAETLRIRNNESSPNIDEPALGSVQSQTESAAEPIGIPPPAVLSQSSNTSAPLSQFPSSAVSNASSIFPHFASSSGINSPGGLASSAVAFHDSTNVPPMSTDDTLQQQLSLTDSYSSRAMSIPCSSMPVRSTIYSNHRNASLDCGHGSSNNGNRNENTQYFESVGENRVRILPGGTHVNADFDMLGVGIGGRHERTNYAVGNRQRGMGMGIDDGGISDARPGNTYGRSAPTSVVDFGAAAGVSHYQGFSVCNSGGSSVNGVSAGVMGPNLSVQPRPSIRPGNGAADGMRRTRDILLMADYGRSVVENDDDYIVEDTCVRSLQFNGAIGFVDNRNEMQRRASNL